MIQYSMKNGVGANTILEGGGGMPKKLGLSKKIKECDETDSYHK